MTELNLTNLDAPAILDGKVPPLEDLNKMTIAELERIALLAPLCLSQCCSHLVSAKNEWLLSGRKITPIYASYIEKAKRAYTKAREDEHGQVLHARAKKKTNVSIGG